VKLLKCVVVGGLLVSANQAFAEDDPAAELRLLKTKLKQLEQRVDDQGRKEKKIEAQADALGQVPPLYKAQPSCPFGKLCYKGITLTFGGWGRPHRHLSHPQPRLGYRIDLQLHSLCAEQEFLRAGITFLGAPDPVFGAG